MEEKNKLKIAAKDGGFLQSQEWSAFQEVAGRKVVKLQSSGEFRAYAIEHSLPVVGSYLFVPRGPVLAGKNFTEKCITELLQAARQNKIAWIRIEPQTKDDLKNLTQGFKKQGYKLVKAKKNHQPAQTLMMDLGEAEDKLLAQMKAKTRYNIRLARKKGVEVSKSRNREAIDAFIKLSQETAKRDGIVIHSEGYYRKMIATVPEELFSLYIAKFQGKIVGATLVSFYGSVATYLHGASSNKNRNVMAPYLLQWTAICEAKKRGFQRYDFGGIKLEKNKDGQLVKNSWSGITRFKLGFCPKCGVVTFPGCWDVVIDKKKYYTYKVLQSLKDIVRRLKIT